MSDWRVLSICTPLGPHQLLLLYKLWINIPKSSRQTEPLLPNDFPFTCVGVATVTPLFWMKNLKLKTVNFCKTENERYKCISAPISVFALLCIIYMRWESTPSSVISSPPAQVWVGLWQRGKAWLTAELYRWSGVMAAGRQEVDIAAQTESAQLVCLHSFVWGGGQPNPSKNPDTSIKVWL